MQAARQTGSSWLWGATAAAAGFCFPHPCMRASGCAVRQRPRALTGHVGEEAPVQRQVEADQVGVGHVEHGLQALRLRVGLGQDGLGLQVDRDTWIDMV